MAADKDVVPIFINFSAQTTSMRTQQSIAEKLEKTRVQYGAPPGKQVVVFVDDINMPATEVYGAQPPIELLRLLVDKKGLFEREDWSWKMVKDTTLLAASAPPGGGRQPTTQRMTRHCHMISMANADSDTLVKIFGSIVSGFLKAGFND
jgi:dynein heavy chain